MITSTEHPKLYILETTRGDSFASPKEISVANMDIFSYVNSKFVYIEKHMRTELRSLYRDIVNQRCIVERRTLENTLTIATQAPDEFAYRLMKSPGHMAVVAGEVVHIIKCIPVEVTILHSKQCYSELQVSWKNNTYYLMPRTRILKRTGTQITCNRAVPVYYKIDSTWYKMVPTPEEVAGPEIIKPTSQANWVYKDAKALATAGIYTEK